MCIIVYIDFQKAFDKVLLAAVSLKTVFHDNQRLLFLLSDLA